MGLAVGALGVVFGDIGTNPLFAIRPHVPQRHECRDLFRLPPEQTVELGLAVEL
jgi:hypothetical protein